MTQSRFTQAGVESVTFPTPESRFTQTGVESVALPIPGSRFTQSGVEVLVSNRPLTRFTQVGLEVIVPNAAPTDLGGQSGQLWPRGGDALPGATNSPSGTAGGIDVTGTYPDTLSVVGLRGVPMVGTLGANQVWAKDPSNPQLIPTTPGGSGAVVQVKNFQTGALATGTTIIPLDDTIPQNTEGDERMTLAITPTSATNKLKIDVVVQATSSQANWVTAALFQDSTASAIAAFPDYQNIGTGGQALVFTHYMTAGTTSATTFKVRVGRDASAGGTVSFNGAGGARLFGGVLASSITITEIVP